MPHNYIPVGSERINKDGYIEVKVADPKTWKQKHRLIYERVHGPIPKDCIVIFKDGDKTNFDINNLLLIKRSVNAVMNHTGLNQYTGDMKETASIMAEMKITTARAKKRKREK